MQNPLLAVHDGCFGIQYRLYPEQLEYEIPVRERQNPAAVRTACVQLEDIVQLRVRRDAQQRLIVRLRGAAQPTRTIALRDDTQGNFLLCRLAERCALLCPQLAAHGFSYALDLRTAWRGTMALFMIALLVLCAAIVLFLVSLPLWYAIFCAVVGVCLLVLFFFRRREYRDLLSIGQVFALALDEEKEMASVGQRELELLATLPAAQKATAQLAFAQETIQAMERYLSSQSSFSCRTLLQNLIRRRTGILTELTRTDVTAALDAWQRTTAELSDKTLPQSVACSAKIPSSLELQKRLYAALKLSDIVYRPMKNGYGAQITARVSYCTDAPTAPAKLDGWIRARVRYEGEDMVMGTLLLPPGGLKQGESCTLRAVVCLTQPCMIEKTAIWPECGRLWEIT